MPDQNVAIAMAAYRAAERQDVSGFDLLDDAVLWDMRGLAMPDLARVYRGRDEVRQFWANWLAAWEAIEFEPEVAEATGDHVIVEVSQRNRGRSSGAEVEFHYFQSFTFRAGRITASHATETLDGAREVLGLA